jgi:hypothetical protein
VWIYNLSDVSVDAIKVDDELQNQIIRSVLRCESQKDTQHNEALRSLLSVLEGRPALPGFEIFKGLNVSSLPERKNPSDENSICSHLGNYFIWPFSYEQIGRIRAWITKQVEGGGKAAIEQWSNVKNIDELKKCKTISDALRDDNSDFNALIAYVAENLTLDISARTQSNLKSESSQKRYLESEVRKRYEKIIVEKLWSYMLYGLPE